MKERPILYSAPMVRARNAGIKRMTRRIVSGMCNRMHMGKLLGDWDLSVPPYRWDGKKELWRYSSRTRPSPGDWIEEFQTDADDHATAAVRCPYGQPGDRLRGKENAWIWCRKERDGDTKTGRPKYNYIPVSEDSLGVIYSADHPQRPTHRLDIIASHDWRLKIGRYIPAWASRMLDEITEVRVERVQDISEADIIAEGVTVPMVAALTGAPWSDIPTLFDAWRLLWCHINGKESWERNVWVWVVSFKPVSPQPPQPRPRKWIEEACQDKLFWPCDAHGNKVPWPLPAKATP